MSEDYRIRGDAEFEARLTQFVEDSNAVIGDEAYEHDRVPFGTPPPIVSDINADYKNIRWFAYHMSDLNPLYLDPEYAAKSKYGCIIAPPTILSSVRYPAAHAAGPYGDYPVSTMFSGTAFEWFDVIRIGTRFKTSKKLREVIEKKGRSGRLFFLIYETFYWDFHDDTIGKSYGTMIDSPFQARSGEMGAVKEEDLLYTRGTYKYTQGEMDKILKNIKAEERRGAAPRYWDDVEEEDLLSPMVKGPWTVTDMYPFDIGHHSHKAFEIKYRSRKKAESPEHPLRVNPGSLWPYGGYASHEDAVLCVQNAFPGPYDYGGQRVTFPEHILTNWMGDEGFIRSTYLQCRRPVFYGDTVIYVGKVVKKQIVTEKGDDAGVPGEIEYAAVDIKIEGINQLGENCAPARCRVYLPSRELGPVKLPIPHPKTPSYIPFLQYIPTISMKEPLVNPWK
jgi:acyl dehydratase